MFMFVFYEQLRGDFNCFQFITALVELVVFCVFCQVFYLFFKFLFCLFSFSFF